MTLSIKPKPHICIALALAALLLNGCGQSHDTAEPALPSEPKLTPEQIAKQEAQAESDRILAEAQHDYELAQIAAPMTRDAYPKTYEQWGDKWMNLINAMMPKAIKMVDEHEQCDKAEYIGLSETESQVGITPVFFVDCANKMRYRLSADDIANGTVPNPDNAY